ncbi:hypothetical protein BC830DRAFT_1128193 [Chytriomyces sp. MP71]|nr:hypothetical protein BC830DRAFT_1128193 [Chytriomyces sp. MP71]
MSRVTKTVSTVTSIRDGVSSTIKTTTTTSRPLLFTPSRAAVPSTTASNGLLSDKRVADLIVPGIGKHVTIVGFPYDVGVSRNGGRVGARDGPKAFLKLVQERRTGTAVNPELGIDITSLEIGLYGLIEEGLSLEDAHSQLTLAVKQVLDAGSIPFIVGGGNDQSYPNAAALLAHLADTPSTSIGVINIDAHLDVRPRTAAGEVHSGTPFRQLLEDERFQRGEGTRFVEFAAQGSQCAQSHVDFVYESGGAIVWLNAIQEHGNAKDLFVDTLDGMGGDKLFVSFDLDAVHGGDAPGVSAPSPMGLSAKDALDICFASGKNPRVALFDLSELNPHIEEYRSARLTAMMFLYFLMGVASRPSFV